MKKIDKSWEAPEGKKLLNDMYEGMLAKIAKQKKTINQ